MLRKPSTRIVWGLPVLAAFAAFAGCSPQTKEAEKKALPEVDFATPVSRTVTEFEEFTGHLVAKSTVAIRSRVSGYLDEVKFEDGAIVKKGDLLFVIDSRSYKATADNAKAMLDQANSRRDNIRSQDERANTLLKRNAIPSEEAEKLGFQRSEAEAAVSSAEAQKALAELDLTYTRITSPIDGTISNRQVDPGNLVKADDTVLSTVVSLDPIYAYFDVNERTVLKFRRLINKGEMIAADEKKLKVQISLADEDDFTHEGEIDFLDNQLDPNTGTLRVRATIHNKSGLLSPGLFVRIRFPVGDPHEALLVQEQALGTDQGQRFVYVINDENKIEYRPVTIGVLDKGQRVIEKGVQLGDRVVVNGLQRIRPKAEVTGKDVSTEVAREQEPDAKVTLVSDKSVQESQATPSQPTSKSSSTSASPAPKSTGPAQQRH
ncbi:efflux RND transporter periplasmic adaptor subunit [Anatilimnocola sp. NA78]|uniref:efflux RND transporter periplasmic adaptor subunit n=1 Tax=Anatilimnocola sp. NA78 TaxID=3415683 RepID=UPI003CE46DD7